MEKTYHPSVIIRNSVLYEYIFIMSMYMYMYVYMYVAETILYFAKRFAIDNTYIKTVRVVG